MRAALGVALAGAAALGSPQEVPLPQHRLLRRFVGDWEVALVRGAQREVRGTERGRLLEGGMWALLDHRGSYDGRSYEGFGQIGYDPRQRRYVGTWMSAFSPLHSTFEGRADEAGRTLTLWLKVRHPQSGRVRRERMVHEFLGESRRLLTFYGRDAAGREAVTAVMIFTAKPGSTLAP